MVQDIVLVIDQQNGNVVVALNDAEEEIDIGSRRWDGVTLFIYLAAAAHGSQLLCCFGPNFHSLAFLFGEVLDQIV